MPANNTGPSKRSSGIIMGCLLVAVLLIAGYLFLKPAPKTPPAETDSAVPEQAVKRSVKAQPLIDYNAMEKDSELKDMMDQRKSEYGLQKGVDIIAKSDESVKIGNTTVSMQEIVEKIRLQHGDIIEDTVAEVPSQQGKTVNIFGIHVVQPGDNIWNIHFRFLKGYFDHRGIMVSPLADEPDAKGFSSGVGKLLKFSENIVYIYNIEEKKLEMDLNLIRPLSKIVIYNMTQVFSLLDSINYDKVNRIQFDGETIWIPADQ